MQDNLDINVFNQQIISLIQTKSDPQEMLKEIARILGQYFRVDICLIVAESQSRSITHIGLWNKDKLINEKTKELLLNPLIKTMITQEEIIAIAELQNNFQSPQMNELAELLPIKALLGISTEFAQNPNGYILLGMLQNYSWTEQEQDVLKEMAKLVAIANAIADQKGEDSDKELNFNLPFTSTRAIPGDNLIKKWYQLTRQQLKQQRQLNELKDEIITTISHEAGTPLATMKLAIEMLYARQDSISFESQQRYWTILKQEWQRLHDLINNIKTLQKLESEELSFNPQPVDLGFIFKEIVQTFREQWQQDKRKRLTLVTEGLLSGDLQTTSDSSLTLYTDSQHFRSILLELLTNAGKFAAPETTVFLKVTQQEKGKQQNLVISVTNTGLGVSQEDQQHIFEPFRRGQGVTDKAIAGTGLGLTLVKGLVELLGGRIEVASYPSNNKDHYVTTFSFTISQSQS